MKFVKPMFTPDGLMVCVTFVRVRAFWLVLNDWPLGTQEM
jgi:hypothetical protein